MPKTKCNFQCCLQFQSVSGGVVISLFVFGSKSCHPETYPVMPLLKTHWHTDATEAAPAVAALWASGCCCADCQ